ncbi:MAG: serine/threonine-protein kinase [Fuerstiella sp.]
MPAADLNKFVQNVLRSKLIERNTLASALQQFKASNRPAVTSVDLAKFLIENGLTTKYQAKRLLAGRTSGFFLGGCRILDRLGKGGMGVVYLAIQERLNRKVALKVLPFRGSENSEAIQRFYREARAAAKLNHLNIVQVFDVNREENTHYIVMQLVEGNNLHELITQQGPFPVGKSLLLIRQAAEGLAHAHKNGIIHRDIKPSNLMLEGTTLKILDLGLAKHESDQQITGDGSVLGTFDYMSPEQCQSTTDADHRSDIYSLGCTWYHLLIGKAPFADRPPAAKMMGHFADELPSVSDADVDVPHEFVRIIGRMTARQPKDRYQDVTELIADIDHLLEAFDRATIVEFGAVNCATDDSTFNTADKVQDHSTLSAEFPLDGDLGTARADASEYHTLVHAPSDSSSISLTYLIPVMAALVLGGVYFGINFLKDRLTNTEALVIDVPSAPGKNTVSALSSEKGRASNEVDNTARTPLPFEIGFQPEHERQTEISVASPPGDPAGIKNTTAVDETGRMTTEDSTEATVAQGPQLREPKEIVIREFGPDWQQDLVDGDILTLVSNDVYEIKKPVYQTTSITLQGTESLHALIYCKVTTGDSFWKQSFSSLSLRHIDLYIDLTDLKKGAYSIFDLSVADFQMKDCTLTVMSSVRTSWEDLSILRMCGSHPWNSQAKGDPPEPLTVLATNSLIRGKGTFVRNLSPLSILTMSNCVVLGTGPLLHAYHVTPREYAHQLMATRIDSCSFDIVQPLITIDCRPFDLRAVPQSFEVKNTAIASSGPVPVQAPLVFWASPADTSSVADALTFTAQNNVYIRRQHGLMMKASDGDVRTLVAGAADWERNQLGYDADSQFIQVSARNRMDRWHSLTAGDFDLRTLPRGARNVLHSNVTPGAVNRTIRTPRRLPSSFR